MLVNFDKKQYVHPHKMDDGYKLGEIAFSSGGTSTALCLLIATNKDRFENDPDGVVGSWAGDRVALVGEYGAGDCERFAKTSDEDTDLTGIFHVRQPDSVWEKVHMDYSEISDSLLSVIKGNK